MACTTSVSFVRSKFLGRQRGILHASQLGSGPRATSPGPSHSDSRPISSVPASDGPGDPLLLPALDAPDATFLALALAPEASVPPFFRGFFRIRAVTLPGASHRKGFALEYPGHTIPASRHFLQVGCPSSQTSLLREHSQQDFCSSGGGVESSAISVS